MTAFEKLALICRNLMDVGVHIWLQSAFVLLLGLLLARMASRRGPALQTAILRSSLSAVLAGAILVLLIGGSPVSLVNLSLPSARSVSFNPDSTSDSPHSPSPSSARGKSANHRRISTPAASSPSSRVAEASVGVSGTRASAAGFAYIAGIFLWLAGTLFLISVTVIGSWRLRGVRRMAHPVSSGPAYRELELLCAEMGLKRPALLTSPDVESPFAVGGRVPVILLPEGFARDSSVSSIRAVLCHELCHLARRDCGWKLFGRIA